MKTRFANIVSKAALVAATLSVSAALVAQTPAAPRQMGAVKAATPTSVTLTNAQGQDFTANFSDATKFLVVPPGSTDLKAATPGTAADIATGDKVLVNGLASDTGSTLTAQRVIVMKANAIASAHAADAAAWAQGGGGIVKAVNAAANTITVSSGMKQVSVVLSPKTIIRHYAGTSVKFEDAVPVTLADIKVGDQLRVRGTKSADGMTINADEVVAGTFHNYSGLISSIDTANNTVTLKDLTTKKTVTVAITPNSDLHRIPPQMAAMIAGRMKGGANGGAQGAPAGAAPAGGGRPGGYGGPGGGARAGADLSAMMARLPAETLSGLKTGEAVMIVATSPASDASKNTAVTLLAGVDAIITAPEGESMTLAPWSIGAPDMGGGSPQ